jgi:hypothetical protein
VVAVLGATGYVILLGAVVLWVRLHEAHFPREVPISSASREELLVMGAQALAVWIVLLLVMLLMAVWLLTTESVSRWEVLAGLALGLMVTIAVLAAIEQPRWYVIAAASLVIVGPAVVIWAGVRLWPPFVHWVAGLYPSVVGIALPLLVKSLAEEEHPTGTVLSAWIAFLVVLAFLPGLLILRRQMGADAAAITQLEMEREELAPDATPPTPGSRQRRLWTVNRLLASLRENHRTAKTRLWARGAAVTAIGLLLLGGVGVASQFEKEKLFRRALVSLNTGRCVTGTYLARNKDNVVLGDQRRFRRNKKMELVEKKTPKGKRKPQNRVVVVPAAEVLELQVSNPTEVGVRIRKKHCRKRALIAPDGTQVEPFRGPPGVQGTRGPRGIQGEKGEQGRAGATGEKGEKGEPGERGPSGPKGEQGDRGPAGPQGERGLRGRQGEAGPAGPIGPRGQRGPRGFRGEALVDGRG